MTLKSKIINEIIEIEGGYVDDPDDSGGETNFDITESVERWNGYKGSMRDLPRSLAFKIYAIQYWEGMLLEKVEIIAGEKITKELADTAINTGVDLSSRFLQRSLNVLNDRAKHYDDLNVDGHVGGKTIAALRSFIKLRGDDGMCVLYKMLNSLQGAFYVRLSERREKDERFIYGWFKNRVS